MDILNTFESFVGQAATNLGVTSGFRTSTTSVVDWEENKNPPSHDALNAEIDRLKAEWDSQEYARKREAEYPSVQECVHAILDDTLDALQAKRASIKTKYPKGG